MGDDYRIDHFGYQPDHYRDFNDEAQELTQRVLDYHYSPYDQMRAAQMEESNPATDYITSMVKPVAVHVFVHKVVIVGKDGTITELKRG